MSEIKFVKRVRNCGLNDTEREMAEKEGRTPRLVHDVDVVIDGEHRAVLSRNLFGRGYDLYDPDHRSIPYGARFADRVPNQAEFYGFVSVLLARRGIPTLAEIAEQRRKDEREKKRKIDEEAERRHRLLIEAAAPALYDALLSIVSAGKADGWPKGWGLARDRALAAIAKVEGQR